MTSRFSMKLESAVLHLARHSDNPAIEQALAAHQVAFDKLHTLVKLTDPDYLDTLTRGSESEVMSASMKITTRYHTRTKEAARAWLMKTHPGMWNEDGSLVERDDDK